MKGFTLIELMVAAAIMMLTAGSIIAGFSTYSDTQKIKQDALTLKNNLRLAQSYAKSGKKPAAICTQLLSYEVSFPSATSYVIQARCTEGLSGAQTTTNLSTGITFSPIPSSVVAYPVLGYGVLDSALTITLTGRGKSFSIQVSPSGEVSELGFN